MTSPGSQKIRVVRSSAICDPTVTTTSSGMGLDALQRHHLADLLAQLAGCPGRTRTAGRPGRPRRSARRPRRRVHSSGSDFRYGMPPASDTTSGRLATANRARIAEARMPAVRCAYRCICRSRLLPVMALPRLSPPPGWTFGRARVLVRAGADPDDRTVGGVKGPVRRRPPFPLP